MCIGQTSAALELVYPFIMNVFDKPNSFQYHFVVPSDGCGMIPISRYRPIIIHRGPIQDCLYAKVSILNYFQTREF